MPSVRRYIVINLSGSNITVNNGKSQYLLGAFYGLSWIINVHDHNVNQSLICVHSILGTHELPLSFNSSLCNLAKKEKKKVRISRILQSFLLELQSTFSLYSGLFGFLKKLLLWACKSFAVIACLSNREGKKTNN